MHHVSVTAAHRAVSPEQLWSAWTFEPMTIAALVGAGVLYGVGVARLRRRRARHAGGRRIAAFYGGLLVLALALLSPVHALGETLFSAHMVQHLLLILVVAPLLVLGAPVAPAVVAAPAWCRRMYATGRRLEVMTRLRRALAVPLLVWALGALAMWSWHLPELYAAGLSHPLWHATEHASFLVTAIAFWTLIVHAGGRAGRGHGAAILLTFATALQGAVLGAVLTFATHPLYRDHLPGASAWGIAPLTDQQLAGLIMWVPAGAVYILVMATLFLAWLRAVERGGAPTGATGRGGQEVAAGTGDGP
jgi:putative membrane protein